MQLSQFLLTIQIVVSLILIAVVLLQAQGAGLGSTWGGGGESYHTKRGVERTLFGLTIILAGVFAIVSLAAIIL